MRKRWKSAGELRRKTRSILLSRTFSSHRRGKVKNVFTGYSGVVLTRTFSYNNTRFALREAGEGGLTGWIVKLPSHDFYVAK